MEKLQIAQMLYAIRIANKKTQTKIANILGVTFQQVQKYEKMVNNISSPNLLKFCNIMKINLSDFQNKDAYQIIEASDKLTNVQKEIHSLKLQELEAKNKWELKNDKSRSDENLAGKSISQRTHI